MENWNMKNLKPLFFLTLTFFLISCKKKEEAIPMWSASATELNNWKELALKKGDTVAYWNLSTDFMDSPHDGFLYTALIMANKHKYHQAYIDAYDCLTDRLHKRDFTELDSLDNNTRELALDILKRGAEKNSECKYILGKYYLDGKYLEKNAKKGNKLIKESKR